MMIVCSIFRSTKKDEMYIYVKKAAGFASIPDALKTIFGEPIHVMDMPLTEKSTLARIDTQSLIASINEQGYYLQMPPPKEEYMLNLFQNRPESGVR